MEQPMYTPEPTADPAAAGRAARRAKRRSFFAALGYLGIYLGMQLIIVVPFTVAAAVRALMRYGQDVDAVMNAVIGAVTEQAVTLTAVSGILTVLVLWLIFACRRKSFFAGIGLAPLRGRTAWLLPVLGLCANGFVSGVLSLLPEAYLQSYNDASGLLLGEISPVMVLFVVILAPIVEEIVFRGLIYTRFRRALPRIAAMLLAALLFGVMHQQPVWIAYAFCLGLLLCAVFERYETLLAPIVLHLSFNGASFLTPLFDSLPGLLVSALMGACCALLLIGLFRTPAKRE